MKTQEKFLEEIAQKNSSITVLGQYDGSHTQIRVRCNICGCEFMATPNSLLNGTGCPLCARENLYEITRKKHSVFVEELTVKNPSVTVLGEYKSNKEHILVKCKVCGTEWLGTPVHLLSGHGCPQCANVKRAEALRRRKRFNKSS